MTSTDMSATTSTEQQGDNAISKERGLRPNLAEDAERIQAHLTHLDAKLLKKKIPVVEVFGPTVQGEGMLIGNMTMFVRTGLCDYKCGRCDSLHAVIPQLVTKNAMWITQAELVVLLSDVIRHIPLITLSGGNPCVHDLMPLLTANRLSLIGGIPRGFALETQGTLWHEWVRLCNFVTVSPKGPGMKEKFEPELFGAFIDKLNPANFMGHWCVKVPVFDQRDIELVVEIMDHWPQTRQRMYISCGNVDPPAPADREHGNADMPLSMFRGIVLRNYDQLLQNVMHDRRLNGVSVLPQLHTLIWGNAACR